MEDDVILCMDYYLETEEGVTFCRICHEEEEEFESFKSLESPCSCRGTSKYAHRDCIQKWCNEKGNTTCEICLQKFEPGFTSIPKISLQPVQTITTGVTIRRSLEVPVTRSPRLTRNYSTIVMVTDQETSLLLINNQEQYCSSSSPAHKTVAFCRSLVIALTVVLLMTHLIDICSSGIAAEYPISLATLMIAKIGGIVIPMYIIIQIMAAVQTNISSRYQSNHDESDDNEDEDEDEESSSDEDELEDEEEQYYGIEELQL